MNYFSWKTLIYFLFSICIWAWVHFIESRARKSKCTEEKNGEQNKTTQILFNGGAMHKMFATIRQFL